MGFGMFVGAYPSTQNILIENIRGFSPSNQMDYIHHRLRRDHFLPNNFQPEF